MDVLIRVVSFILVLNLGLSIVRGSCPPLGRYECVKFPRYYDRQYATCLTDKYIQSASSSRHQCLDRTVEFCWYQCMLDVHDKEYECIEKKGIKERIRNTSVMKPQNYSDNIMSESTGEVTNDCSCDQLNSTAKQDIPLECYSPSGDECGWYENCFDERYHCKDDPASYAVDFAKKFCLLYDQHYPQFSRVGQLWINATRKCLQVKLVPALRPGQKKTCAELRDFAFGTHFKCYVSPDVGPSSVCKLTPFDFQKVFWTIKQGFHDIDSSKTDGVVLSILAQMLEVGTYCSEMWTLKTIPITHAAMDIMEFALKVSPYTSDDVWNWIDSWRDLKDRHRKKRSVTSMGNSVSNVVYKLTNQSSTTMRWDENHVLWFGYPVSVYNNNATSNATLNVRIMLASKGMFDLNAVNVPIVNVSSSVQDLSDAIVNGDLKFNLGKDIIVTLFKVCSDINCTNSTFETVPQNYNPDTKYNEDGNSTIIRNVLIGCSVGVILCCIAGVVIYKLRK